MYAYDDSPAYAYFDSDSSAYAKPYAYQRVTTRGVFTTMMAISITHAMDTKLATGMTITIMGTVTNKIAVTTSDDARYGDHTLNYDDCSD